MGHSTTTKAMPIPTADQKTVSPPEAETPTVSIGHGIKPWARIPKVKLGDGIKPW